jgi:hypothetical protein
MPTIKVVKLYQEQPVYDPTIVIKLALECSAQLKLFHWQTTSYSNHKSADALMKKISELIDSFVEKYVGVFGRPTMKDSSIPLTTMNKTKFLNNLKVAQEFLRGPLEKIISKNSELLNIRDEMLAEIDQALYLFTLT